MKKPFVFKFFQDIPPLLRKLEGFVEGDNKIRIDITILRLKKLVEKFKEDIQSAYIEVITGGS